MSSFFIPLPQSRLGDYHLGFITHTSLLTAPSTPTLPLPPIVFPFSNRLILQQMSDYFSPKAC